MAVGADGMSGEETDDEASSGGQKCLARVPIKWIDSELAQVFRNIDTWTSLTKEEGFTTSRGHRALQRTMNVKPADPTAIAVGGLPWNWYDQIWYRSLSDGKKAILNVQAMRPVPTLVCIKFITAIIIFNIISGASR